MELMMMLFGRQRSLVAVRFCGYCNKFLHSSTLDNATDEGMGIRCSWVDTSATASSSGHKFCFDRSLLLLLRWRCKQGSQRTATGWAYRVLFAFDIVE